VERTTDGSGKVTEMAWADIQRLDASANAGELWRGVRIPRFEQVLELVDGRIGLNIHVKDPGANGQVVRRVCDLLREHAVTAIAYIAGDEPTLQIAHAYDPEIARACLASQDDPLLQIEVARRYACQRVQFGRNVTAEQIGYAHEVGLVCNLFWSDDPGEALEYTRERIDVILTNCAHKLVAGGFPAAPRGV
jgi:glycerophosphoryl diester phosphodiesterase